MADEYDYTSMWSGVYTPPRNDDDHGVYLLDDESSIGRDNGYPIRDEGLSLLYDGDVHPRTHPGGQRYPGPFGAGRASDRVGPTPDERHRAERFGAAKYTQGSRALGHPGFRGMVTSGREGRPAVDDVAWDDRPPHYADDTPNKHAHLYVDPEARGPPLFQKDTTYPGFRQVDAFSGKPSSGKMSIRDSVEIIKTVIFFVIILLVALWLAVNSAVSSAEKRILERVNCAVREALADRG